MLHFKILLEAPGMYVTLYFNKVFTIYGWRYLVSVANKNRKVNTFQMVESRGEWIVADPDKCPDWVVEKAWEFGKIISDHHRTLI